jgi:chemosensory pili system protein ChpE/L-lysine exporter family protein LysE/ArgO
MPTLLLASFILGLVFNAAPGPVFAETVHRSVTGGFRSALAVQIGSLAGDALWAVLGLAGVGMLLQLEALRIPTGIGGIAYLLWLAWDAWRASGGELPVPGTEDEAHRRQSLHSGILLSLTNPQNVAYWAAMGSALSALGVHEPTFSDYSVFFTGFMLSSIVWAFVFAALVDRIFRSAGARWVRVTYRVCAIAFLLLAFSSLRDLWLFEPRPGEIHKSEPNRLR